MSTTPITYSYKQISTGVSLKPKSKSKYIVKMNVKPGLETKATITTEYLNPFVQMTLISDHADAKARVYDILGKKVELVATCDTEGLVLLHVVVSGSCDVEQTD